MYPVYQSLDPNNTSGKVLTSPPLFRVKFANLITNTSKGDSAMGSSAKDYGLLGTIQGFTYSPDLESGFFTSNDNAHGGDLLPQTISLSCDFSVIHDHELGFDQKGDKAITNFPYGEVPKLTQPVGEGSTTPEGQRHEEVQIAEQTNTLNNSGGQT